MPRQSFLKQIAAWRVMAIVFMKAILTKPRLNAAFKVVQPLPVLTSTLPVDLHYAAAPQFNVTWRATEATRNPTHAVALDGAENGAGERSRGLATVVAGLSQHGGVSRALEARMIG